MQIQSRRSIKTFAGLIGRIEPLLHKNGLSIYVATCSLGIAMHDMRYEMEEKMRQTVSNRPRPKKHISIDAEGNGRETRLIESGQLPWSA